MIKIYVGDITKDLGIYAKAQDSDAKLVTSLSYKNLEPGTYFVSLGDLDNLQQFRETLSQADTLIYYPPVKWSDHIDDVSLMKVWTEFYVATYQKLKGNPVDTRLCKIENLTHMLSLRDYRKTSESQLWIAGCSLSHGTGVSDNQRYGQLLSNYLNKPVSFLTCPSSSITWAADQILRSDLRPNDIVVWGLTSFNRFVYYEHNQFHHVNVSYYIQNPEFDKIVSMSKLDDDDDLIYQNVCSIYSVVNFCKKLNVKLFLIGLLTDYNNIGWMNTCENFLQLYGMLGLDKHNIYLDYGSDGFHPGPLTHEWYAKQIMEYFDDQLC
jgi:hypothetical protein